MKTKNGIRQLKAMMQLYSPSYENIDVQIISSVMDELSGLRPIGTTEKIELRQYKLTGYVFPASKELSKIFHNSSFYLSDSF